MGGQSDRQKGWVHLLALLGGSLSIACGSGSTDSADPFALPDGSNQTIKAKDAGLTTDAEDEVDDVAALDSSGLDTAPGTDAGPADSSPPDAAVLDAAPAGHPPVILAIPPLTLAQGASTTLDLNPLMSDLEDKDDALKLQWSALHVALKDPGSHVVYIVAPTTWTGTEKIEITVRDTAGEVASEALWVTVTEVKVEPPKPVDTCGQVVFSIQPGKGEQKVELSGSFNSWGKEAMTGSAGIWTLKKTLTPGVYQYKFVVDGSQWLADPNNPNQVPDGYGGKNSVVEVPKCAP